jgi:ABC-2 type transport system permease protein
MLLLFGSALYLMSTIGIGLFISTISQTQQQALMSSFFFYLPAVLLSGFMFPISNMPEPAQWLTYLNPLRYFLEIIRAIFLKGSGLDALWPQFAALAALGTALLTISSLRFQKRMT